jgi:hypothetical protein
MSTSPNSLDNVSYHDPQLYIENPCCLLVLDIKNKEIKLEGLCQLTLTTEAYMYFLVTEPLLSFFFFLFFFKKNYYFFS